MLVKAVSFRLEGELPAHARFLLEDFRLAVNRAIRAGLQTRLTSRYALHKLAYKDFRTEHPGMYAQHLVSVFEIAASVLKNHRRKVRKGETDRIPYVKRLFMKTVNQAYKLDRERGVIDLPIRAGCHVELKLVLSEYHKGFLDDPSLSLGSLALFPDRVVIAFRKTEPRPYVPESVVSLDTNERSLDGVFVSEGKGTPVKAPFPRVAAIQLKHHDRRKRLQKKKSRDRRTSRRLCRREGKREHDRVEYRMHQVANAVLDFAEENTAAIVLEDLEGGLQAEGGQGPQQTVEHVAEEEAPPVHRVQGQVERNTGPQGGPEEQQQEVPGVWEITGFPKGHRVQYASAAGVSTGTSTPASTCCRQPSRKRWWGVYGSTPARSSMT